MISKRLRAKGVALDWPGALSFLAKRAVPGLESVRDRTWLRVISVRRRGAKPVHGVISVSEQQGHLLMTASSELSLFQQELEVRLRRFFDLDFDPAESADALGELQAGRPGLRMPGALDGFEIGVRAILGQQVSVAAATTFAGRFAKLFGSPWKPQAKLDIPGASSLHTCFPMAAVVAEASPEAIATIGIPKRRAQTLHGLACAIADGQVSLDSGADAAQTRDALLTLPGIGPWTVEYLAMRALRDRDAFPASDLILLRALGAKTAAQSRRAASRFRPYRAHAVLHLWMQASQSGGSDSTNGQESKR